MIIQKYGGATLSDPEKIKAVAKRISDLSKNGTQVVAVVSAMGKTTNQLIQLAGQVSTNPNRREMDMLLSTGERVSMALVSIALNDLGCQAISFTGSQAGILTDDSHVNALITDVKAFRVEQALKENKVVVLAGFQGVSPITKEITTLGRGGSDITAIALGAFLKAERCEILKDVAAVFTADPNIIPDAKPLLKLTYDQLLDMTFWGAKVLQYRSVELAKRNKVPLYVGPASSELADGTLISDGGSMPNAQYETPKILALNSHETVLLIKTQKLTSDQALPMLENFLTEKEIPFPQLLSLETSKIGIEMVLTGPAEVIQSIERELPQSKDFQIHSDKMSSVTATCTSSTSSDIPKMVLKKLSENKIEIPKVILNPMSISLILKQKDREKTLKALHELI
ncbi:MAG: aspartokinase [Oligoflexia bacterium]|nr:MAG: aspartokinase [Oligoflexia bacterium]